MEFGGRVDGSLAGTIVSEGIIGVFHGPRT
jgi:hypothetical protein